jgi:hypothetical protein
VEAAYGPPTEANRMHLRHHLENMERMITEVFRYDRRLWTEDHRQRVGMDPLELVNDFRVAAGVGGRVYDTDDLRLRYMQAYRRHADDDLIDADASVTGSSAMSDAPLFPSSLTMDDAHLDAGAFS